MENNKIIIKDYFESKLTIILDDNNKAWFNGCDVAKILGYVDKKQAVRKNVDLEDKLKLNELVGVFKNAPLNSQPHTIYINESGLYSLVFGSKMENAKKFKRWVTNEIKPSIREIASYSVKKGSRLQGGSEFSAVAG